MTPTNKPKGIGINTLINAFPIQINEGGWQFAIRIGGPRPEYWKTYPIVHLDRDTKTLVLSDSGDSMPINLSEIRVKLVSVSHRTVAIIAYEKAEEKG